MSRDDERLCFEGLYPDLRRFAAVVGSSDIEPDDLVQEALVRSLEQKKLLEVEDPGAYLRRIVVNLASNRRRKLGRWRSVKPQLERDALSVVPDDYPSDLADLDQVAALDRAVLFLTIVEGRSAADAGLQLGLSANAVRLRSSRSLKTLKRQLDSESASPSRSTRRRND